jgi:hypothetical protein
MWVVNKAGCARGYSLVLRSVSIAYLERSLVVYAKDLLARMINIYFSTFREYSQQGHRDEAEAPSCSHIVRVTDSSNWVAPERQVEDTHDSVTTLCRKSFSVFATRECRTSRRATFHK